MYTTKAKKKKKFTSGLAEQQTIYSLLQAILTETPADRVMIIKTENGGGIPSHKNPVYMSVMYEVYQNPMRAILEEMQRVRAGSAYIDLILQLADQSKVTYETQNMPAGLLRDINETDGIQSGQKHYINNNEKAFYYLSISSRQEQALMETPQARRVIALALNKIQNIFS